jgi:hypothetical protein
MTDMEMKRAFVAEMYPGEGWQKKVRKMSDKQVFAIFMREQHKAKKEEPKKESNSDEFPF